MVAVRSHLSKFRLSISTKVFITEAARELEVSRHSTGHENLLVLLRTLRKSVGLSLLSGRHYEFTSSLRGRLEQQRCLYLHKGRIGLFQYLAADIACFRSESERITQLAAGSQLEVPMLGRVDNLLSKHHDLTRKLVQGLNRFQHNLPRICELLFLGS